tara:strand:+ start:73731 stop:74096 length:366 start_codon:yes stop_codon:yes gene_type:complete
MDMYQRQQFGFFLQTATERYVARLEERFRGADGALEILQRSPVADETGLDCFTDAVFEDFLLNNVDGACFILQSLAGRRVESIESGSVEETLVIMAKTLFADLLLQKTIETLEQHSGYQSV